MDQTLFTNAILVFLTTVLIFYGAYPIMYDEKQPLRRRWLYLIASIGGALVIAAFFVYLHRN
jgi:hypothetical protein